MPRYCGVRFLTPVSSRSTPVQGEGPARRHRRAHPGRDHRPQLQVRRHLQGPVGGGDGQGPLRRRPGGRGAFRGRAGGRGGAGAHRRGVRGAAVRGQRGRRAGAGGAAGARGRRGQGRVAGLPLRRPGALQGHQRLLPLRLLARRRGGRLRQVRPCLRGRVPLLQGAALLAGAPYLPRPLRRRAADGVEFVPGPVHAARPPGRHLQAAAQPGAGGGALRRRRLRRQALRQGRPHRRGAVGAGTAARSSWP